MNKLGIMQGRLTEWGFFNPQQFPWKNWENEFYLAEKFDIKFLEWMFNAENYIDNPVWTHEGRQRINYLIKDTGINLSAICANFFIEKSILELGSFDLLYKLVNYMKEINVNTLIIPLFGNSNIESEKNLKLLFNRLLALHIDCKIDILIETNLKIKHILCFKQLFFEYGLKICYDIGNAVGNHYDVCGELEMLLNNKILGEVHIKDKNKENKSVFLGSGDAEFNKYFSILKDYNYNGMYILENYYDNSLKQVKSGIDLAQKLLIEE